jgi:hypothetical protein
MLGPRKAYLLITHLYPIIRVGIGQIGNNRGYLIYSSDKVGEVNNVHSDMGNFENYINESSTYYYINNYIT